MKRNKLMEELREQITPEIRELVDREMLVETRLLKWMKQTNQSWDLSIYRKSRGGLLGV